MEYNYDYLLIIPLVYIDIILNDVGRHMVDTLYFKCYYAYLQKDLAEAQLSFDMLKDELKSTKGPNPLSKDKLVVLSKIRDSLRSGVISGSSWVDDSVPIRIPKQSGDIFHGNQDDLVKKIYYEAKAELGQLLGADSSFYLDNLEHPCGIHGAVDMVYADRTTIYPIEVKKDEGKHDIISQISKYDLSFKMHLHLNIYSKVIPATLCASYQNNVIKELKSLGVQVLLYRILDNKVRLSRV